MDRLPPELLLHILTPWTSSDSYENRSFLLQLRYLSKKFAAVVAPYAFATFPLWISYNSLQNFSDMSKHPLMYGLLYPYKAKSDNFVALLV